MNELTSTEQVLAPAVLDSLASELKALGEQLIASEGEVAHLLAAVHPENLPSARNLVHYLALRRNDVRDLQHRLARAGLSPLSGCEAHVLVTINRIIELLSIPRDTHLPDTDSEPVGFREGEAILADNADRLLGPCPERRAVRIMVTLPKEAAKKPAFARKLMVAGMNCARINCARGEAEQWTAMAQHVRGAERSASGWAIASSW